MFKTQISENIYRKTIMEILDETELQALHKQHIKMEIVFNFF